MISNKELIGVLVDVQHRYLRKTLQYLFNSVKKLADEGDKNAETLVPEIVAMLDALEDHFKGEEQDLFSKILRAEKAGTPDSGEPGALEFFEVTVRELISEHEETKAFFDKVVGLSESLEDEHEELAGGFVTLAVVLNAHILLEEELLFPRAEALFAG
ncbi:MAG: hemerythrin domain-containing protein [Candidatus Coatesbacteria bacterium]|nr:MAG: hemerythrin domain-containing protein [Candidatus Coatesbacteria bacterium]